jgi:hypothetical protein
MKRMACNKSRWKAANQSKDWRIRWRRRRRRRRRRRLGSQIYSCPCACHEDMRGNASTAQHVLKLGTRWKWVSASRRGRFTLGERAAGTHWVGG